jgi:hypothetical protein
MGRSSHQVRTNDRPDSTAQASWSGLGWLRRVRGPRVRTSVLHPRLRAPPAPSSTTRQTRCSQRVS